MPRSKGRVGAAGSEVRKRAIIGVPALLPALVLIAACGTAGNGSSRVATFPTRSLATPTPTWHSGAGDKEAVTGTPTPQPSPTSTSTPVVPLAALVNGQAILLATFEQQVAQTEQALLQQGLDPASQEGQAQMAEVRVHVLDTMIDQVLIEQAGTAMGIRLGEGELDAEVETSITAGGGQATFDQWLESTGLTAQDFESMLRQALIEQRVFEAVTADVADHAEQVHIRHIQVDSEETAQEIAQLLHEGADFEGLAEERSLDVETKSGGGDLGWFTREQLAPEFASVVLALEPGDVSGVIREGGGYHIVQVVERESARPLSPEDQLALKQAAFVRWLERQRDGAVIERLVHK